MHRFRPAELVIATGSIEQPLVFGNNDLPGVMLGGAARRLVNQFRIDAAASRPWSSPSSDEGIDAALDLADGGVNVIAVADSRRDADGSARRGRRHRVPGRLPAVAGEGLEGRSPAWSSRATASTARSACDLLVMSGGSVGQYRASSAQGGGSIRYDRDQRRYVPDALPEGMRVVGAAAGSAAAAGAVPAQAPKTRLQAVRLLLRGRHHQGHRACRWTRASRSLELSKRYTTVTMGPCQGRMCHRNSGLVIADELGLDPDAQRVGVTTARPPHNPTSFSLLAARGYEPVKRTSTHHWHAEHGGKMLWAGDWKRPYDYGDADAEVGRGARVAGPDRRLHAGQADRARARRRRVPGADLPQPLRRHEAGPRPLRHRLRRRRLDHRRRHRGPAVRARSTTSPPPRPAPAAWSSGSPGGTRSGGWTVQIVNVTSAIAAFNLAGPNARDGAGAS